MSERRFAVILGIILLFIVVMVMEGQQEAEREHQERYCQVYEDPESCE